MSVRKRTWPTRKGETKEARVVASTDQHKNGHIKTFKRKKTLTPTTRRSRRTSRREHTPDSHSITVKEAGERWIRNGEALPLERTTLDQYRTLLKLHIVPYLGSVKLSERTAPAVSDFRTKLLEGALAPGEEVGTKRSPYMVKRITTALSSILADAQEHGLVAQNVARSLVSRRKKKSKAQQRRKLRVGVDIPTPAEIQAIVAKLDGGAR
jgi:hypothetical protein